MNILFTDSTGTTSEGEEPKAEQTSCGLDSKAGGRKGRDVRRDSCKFVQKYDVLCSHSIGL